jgi:hypothetical protein
MSWSIPSISGARRSSANSKRIGSIPGTSSSFRSKSTVISAALERFKAPAMRSKLAMSSFSGNSPFWNELSWKISPKLGAITQRN